MSAYAKAGEEETINLGHGDELVWWTEGGPSGATLRSQRAGRVNVIPLNSRQIDELFTALAKRQRGA